MDYSPIVCTLYKEIGDKKVNSINIGKSRKTSKLMATFVTALLLLSSAAAIALLPSVSAEPETRIGIPYNLHVL